MILMIYMVSFGLIAWFLLIRPQRRMQQQHQQMLSNLKRGDEVMTDGGIIGTIVHITDDRSPSSPARTRGSSSRAARSRGSSTSRAMSVRELRYMGDPVLRQRAAPVAEHVRMRSAAWSRTCSTRCTPRKASAWPRRRSASHSASSSSIRVSRTNRRSR
jgi:preprotein translocase YajC subunit